MAQSENHSHRCSNQTKQRIAGFLIVAFAVVVVLVVVLSSFSRPHKSPESCQLTNCYDKTTEKAKTLAPSSVSYKNQSRRLVLEGNKDISFIAIGDWGSRRDRQYEVARAMGRWCSKVPNNCDFILSTGDNIYSRGVDSVMDKHFNDTWNDVYTHPGIAKLPWYLTVGNHDHRHSNGEWFQVQYSQKNSRWNMPSLAFAFEVASKETTVKFVSIDTVSIEKGKNSASDMISLLRSELANANRTGWKVVFGHYPLYSGGEYSGGEYNTIRKSVLPILKDNDVDFYISGHDHNQQHWVESVPTGTRGLEHVTTGTGGLEHVPSGTRGLEHVTTGAGGLEHVPTGTRGLEHVPTGTRGLEHVTTGAGGKSRYRRDDSHVRKNKKLGMELKHFEADYGFAYFVVKRGEMLVKFVNTDGKVVYESVRYH